MSAWVDARKLVGWWRAGWARLRPPVPLFYDEAYRPPLTELESSAGVEPRAVDFIAWYLLEARVLRPEHFHRPRPVSYAELSRVHGAAYLESLGRPETLARIFGVDPSDVPVDALLHTQRLICGGTLGAARLALSRRGPAANLAGGLHHAMPDKGGGFCVFNDIAVAVAVLRAEGFSGRVGVVDLDAHPPDGTAACLAGDARAWVGSLSGSDWGRVPGVDEVLLPPGCDDATYLHLLRELLARMPRVDLAFVLAGGDVLKGDRLGRVGLSLEGARRRDGEVASALRGTASVWLPGGGYHAQSWKVFAGTVLVLTGRGRRRITARFDPLSARYARVARRLAREEAAHAEELFTLTQEDLEGSLGRQSSLLAPRLLGHYTAQSLEYRLYRYGLLPYVERLGYGDLTVELESTGTGDRMKLLGQADGQRHLLVDLVVERQHLGGEDFLFVNWLTLRHPRAHFSELRPRLPGQEVPGLGLAREVAELLDRGAENLGLAGVAFRPMSYHLAVVASSRYRFLDPERQGRFEALRAALAHLSLLEATRAVAEGRVRLEGAPYTWEPDVMVSRVAPGPEDAARVATERGRRHFTVAPAAS
jgi:acetoin utilization deacetylase AcuC-like enzyme